MKRTLTLLVTLGLLATASAQTSAEEVIRAVIDNQRGTSGRVTITMTVEKPGRTSEFVIDSVSDGHDRSLIRVIAPAREAGQAFLTDGNNLWLYNPRLGRSLRLPPSARGDSFLGSDISYRDLAGRDLEAHYQAVITAAEAERIELTLTPRPGAPTPYGQIVITADAATYAPRALSTTTSAARRCAGSVSRRSLRSMAATSPPASRWRICCARASALPC